jgi:hypothetical protein
MAAFMKWLVLGWSMVVFLLWAFLSFRQWVGDQPLFADRENVWGFMGVVFLTWIIPVALFAFFGYLAHSSKSKQDP